MAAGPAAKAAGAAAEASWRQLETLRADGAWQMACDALLLQLAEAEGSVPLLRFYHWSRPTLSLGFHQKRLEAHWPELAAAGQIELVRRPSGGRAVLHAGSLTYALIWPSAPSRRLEAYRQACGWLQAGFAELGLPLHFGAARAGSDRSSCFALATGADLVHGCGAKRIGSAQLRRRGHLLQHGSILVAPPQRLWQAVFGSPPPSLPPLPWPETEAAAALEQHLIGAARRWMPGALGLAAGDPTPWTLCPEQRRAINRRSRGYLLAPQAPAVSDDSPP